MSKISKDLPFVLEDEIDKLLEDGFLKLEDLDKVNIVTQEQYDKCCLNVGDITILDRIETHKKE